MIRRRPRRERDTPFSFDSFLDVVANVVGIIIRLILVAWVGARSYSSLQPQPCLPKERPPHASTSETLADPLQVELERSRRELADLQARLLEKLRELQQAHDAQAGPVRDAAHLADLRQRLEHKQQMLQATASQAEPSAALSLAELRERCAKLTEQIRALEKEPPRKQVLRYQTPVSKPLHAEELLFECKHGRVAFIDVAPMLAEVQRSLEDRKQELRKRWQIREVTNPVGAFRLRYTIERERGVLDGAFAGAAPDPNTGFRFGVTGWEVEPVAAERGEPVAEALRPGSQFRQTTDRLDPQHQAVTFWVYPDSFELYRRLRDYLHERDVVVAGRPLPPHLPIASSRHGSASRGQ